MHGPRNFFPPVCTKILKNTVIEYENTNLWGGNTGLDDNSNFTLIMGAYIGKYSESSSNHLKGLI